MWNILLPDINVIYKKEWSDLTPYQIRNGARPDDMTEEEKELKHLLTTEYNRNVSLKEYLNLPKVKQLLNEQPAYDSIIRACYYVEHKHLGQRKNVLSNGDKFMQRTGMIAQTILADYLEVKQQDCDGYDNGVDLQVNGVNVDIKCMGRTQTIEYDWVHNLVKSQFDNQNSKTDFYLFCSLDRKDSILQVCGFMQKSLIPKCAEYFKEGSQRINNGGHLITVRADMFEINQDVLCAINHLDDIERKFKPENIVRNPADEDVQKCVLWHKMIKAAETNEKAKEMLHKCREKRFKFLLEKSSFTSLIKDSEYMVKCSVDCELDHSEALQKINRKYSDKFFRQDDAR